MTEVWITHPKLTPAHDHKILREAIGSKVASGWEVREDQSDPVEAFEPADPRELRLTPDRSVPESPARPRHKKES